MFGNKFVKASYLSGTALKLILLITALSLTRAVLPGNIGSWWIMVPPPSIKCLQHQFNSQVRTIANGVK